MHSCESASDVAAQLAAHEKHWRIQRSNVCSSTEAVVISDFLPASVARHWHGMMNSTWEASAPCREHGDCTRGGENGTCNWLYATNSHGGNAKVRSVFEVQQRRKFVQDAYRRGMFAYSKWELSAGHPLFGLIGAVMDDEAVRAAVARAMRLPAARPMQPPPLGNISDYFITSCAFFLLQAGQRRLAHMRVATRWFPTQMLRFSWL